MRTNQRVSAPWCSQLSWFDHLLGSSAQLTIARDAPRERCWPQSHWESGACRFINSNLIMFSVRRNASSYPFQSAVRLVTNGKNQPSPLRDDLGANDQCDQLSGLRKKNAQNSLACGSRASPGSLVLIGLLAVILGRR